MGIDTHISPMVDSDMARPGIMPAMGLAVRGLSALFWGLPLALLTCARTAMGDSWRAVGVFTPMAAPASREARLMADTIMACLPSVAALALLLYGLRCLIRFQSEERVWVAAVDRATLLVLLLMALVPFAHWWHLAPGQPMFRQSLGLFMFAGIGFMLSVNHVLRRLAAMLPDEVLKSDTRLFAAVNQYLILLLAVLLSLELVTLWAGSRIPAVVHVFLEDISDSRPWLFIMLALLPLALTMTLLWKAKEAIVTSVFRPEPL